MAECLKILNWSGNMYKWTGTGRDYILNVLNNKGVA